MWHFKTKLGVFWVAPITETSHNVFESAKKLEKNQKYYLGVDDQELGVYTDAELAAKDVHDQKTGFYQWDSMQRVKAPEHINEWSSGEPKEWS